MTAASQQVKCVVLAAGGWRVEGTVHVMSGTRLTDMMNSSTKSFLPITEAVVFDTASGEILFRPPYLALNRAQIAVIFPAD